LERKCLRPFSGGGRRKRSFERIILYDLTSDNTSYVNKEGGAGFLFPVEHESLKIF